MCQASAWRAHQCCLRSWRSSGCAVHSCHPCPSYTNRGGLPHDAPSGQRLAYPALFAPMAQQRLCHPEGELAMARAAAAAGLPFVLSTMATSSMQVWCNSLKLADSFATEPLRFRKRHPSSCTFLAAAASSWRGSCRPLKKAQGVRRALGPQAVGRRPPCRPKHKQPSCDQRSP